MRRTGHIKGINRVTKRLTDGRRVEYHYVRGQSGPAFWQTGDDCQPGSAEYERRFNEAKKGGRTAKTTGTFNGVIDAWLTSASYKNLSPRTKYDYGKWADRIRDKFGSAPKAAFESPEIRPIALAWRDQWEGRQAQYGWTVLRRIVSWAYDAGHLKQHHLKGGGNVYSSDRSEIIWLPEHQEAFDAVAPDWARRILGAALETGLRPGDLVRLTRQHVEPTPGGRVIRLKTSKKGRVAEIPVTPAMSQILDATPPRLLILVSEQGRPLSVTHASRTVKRYARAAGLPDDLRLYDCRGTAATRLLRAGASLGQIARCMGWSLRYAQNVIETYASSAEGESDAVLTLLARGDA